MDNNESSGAPSSEDPFLNTVENKSSNGSNGNKNSSRASSIEALNWSDFEDDINDDENKEISGNLLQSIHSSTIVSDSDSTGSSISKMAKDQLQDASKKTNLEKKGDSSSATGGGKIDEPFEHLEELRLRRGRMGIEEMVTSFTSVKSETSSVAPDQMSNIPVLDDGPIWSKGEKHYRFEENRAFNQKLSFWLLLTGVLVLGMGVGNYWAYNECEQDHKINDQYSCAKYDEKAPAKATTPLIKPTATEHSGFTQKHPGMSTVPDNVNHPASSTKTSAEFIASHSAPIEKKPKAEKQMIDPDYKLHAQELSRVLKMLDDLSRKIDQFENTTRQLGGIIMMRDENVKPIPAKSKFFKLLDEVVHTKGIGAEVDGIRNNRASPGANDQEKDWNVEAEKVLDKIAEAVLNVMNSNIITKKDDQLIIPQLDEGEETKLETSDVFQFDESPNTASDGIIKPKDNRIDSLHISSEVSGDEILEELKPSTLSITPNHKFGEDSDLEFEYKIEKDHQRYRRESFTKFDGDVQDFEEFKEKHQKVLKNKNQKVKRINSKKHQSDSDSDDDENKQKVKKQKSKSGKKKSGNDEIEDWQADRAKIREENRVQIQKNIINQQQKNGRDGKNKRLKNWQIERDVGREKFREKK